MLKFQFARMQTPQAPSWDHKHREWEGGANDVSRATSVDVWNWLCGNHSSSEPTTSEDTAPTLVEALGDKSETVRLNAAYTLGKMGAICRACVN